ncbi:TetR/AcrR family transcriptional regulator [uncultured Pseudokineococcus sp.]|uniref:TetR/AcrR family transcriptional regulator n=1 Tax=uncultured Pseudokineococcus sp. TaxID=1642928 RepID=UPI0026390372|nr:TetR/AcrR family transcriptional regulator [uncultured Pseudokineococcus sp.]
MSTRVVGLREGARPTREQIDARILDVAAELFATHGLEGTSVQQVADAVGYSKTGLLHRFGSKQGLHAAVLGEAERVLREVLAEVRGPGGSCPRDALARITRRAVERPGLVDLLVRHLQAPPQGLPTTSLQELALELLDALGPDGGPRRRLRVVLALQLVVNAVLAQRGDLDASLPPDELVELVTELAAGVLGLDG